MSVEGTEENRLMQGRWQLNQFPISRKGIRLLVPSSIVDLPHLQLPPFLYSPAMESDTRSSRERNSKWEISWHAKRLWRRRRGISSIFLFPLLLPLLLLLYCSSPATPTSCEQHAIFSVPLCMRPLFCFSPAFAAAAAAGTPCRRCVYCSQRLKATLILFLDQVPSNGGNPIFWPSWSVSCFKGYYVLSVHPIFFH